jgi:eukaryotic-like serine/threonine-protein kinase
VTQSAETLAGRYALEERIFVGGIAEVHRARDATTGALVAVKRPRPDVPAERVTREGDLLAAVIAPGIVRLVDRGHDEGGRPFLVLEWLEGESLSRRLARGTLEVPEAIALGTRIAGALAAAHARGIIHRDLKPSNIVVTGDRLEQATLIDFGIGRVILPGDADDLLTLEGTVLGTPGYLAPEQARGLRDVDARADLFALGCVLYRCLAGRPVFAGAGATAVLAKILLEEAPRLREACPAAPRALDELVAQLLAKDPAARPPSAEAVLAALGAMDLGEITPTPAPRPRVLGGEERRLLAVVALGGAASASVREVAADLDGVVEALADGSSVIAFAGAASATKLAERAGRLALASLGETPTAVATGIGAVGGPGAAGEVIDRVVGALAHAELGAAWLDDVTASLLGPRFAVERARGGYRLRGERDRDERAAPKSPLFGREVELVSFQALFDECAGEPVARAALVTGPSGIGKSRLGDELLARIRVAHPDVEIWRGRGDAGARAAPYGILAGCVREACGIRGGEPAEVQREKLRERLASLEVVEAQPFLAEAMGVGEAHSDALRAARRDPALMADRTAAAAIAWVRAECARRPLLLALDDLHWGDRPSLSLFLAMVRELAALPLFVLGLARPDVDARLTALWDEPGARRVVLGGLLSRNARALVERLLGAGESEAVARIVAQAEGNPLHLEELARAHAAGQPQQATTAPLALVQARIEQFTPAARRVLRGAALFGAAFWQSPLVALTGLEATVVVAELERLARAAVLVPRRVSRFPGEQEHAFAHDTWREAAHATLTDDDRALGHGFVADWLARQPGEHDPLVLADHLDRAGRRDEAAQWYGRAAEQALAGNDLSGARDRAERAVACGAAGVTLGAARLVQAEALEWAGDYHGAIDAGRDAMARLSPASTAWFRAATVVASALGQQGDREGLLALVASLPQAPIDGEAAVSELVCLARTAVPLFQVAEMAQATAALERAIALAHDLGPRVDPAAAGWLDQARSWLTFFQGDMAESYRYDALSAESFKAAGDARNACRQLGNAGFYKMMIGAFDEADALLAEAQADAERFGLARVLSMTLQNLGLIHFMRGNHAEAIAIIERAVEIARAQAASRMEGIARVYLARALRAAGRLADAEREARRGLVILDASPPLRPYALAALADVLLAQGRTAEAEEPALAAAALLVELPCMDEGETFVRLVAARTHDALGRRDEAVALLTASRDLLLARAEAVGDARTFLERIPENADTVALAAAWGCPPPARVRDIAP